MVRGEQMYRVFGGATTVFLAIGFVVVMEFGPVWGSDFAVAASDGLVEAMGNL